MTDTSRRRITRQDWAFVGVVLLLTAAIFTGFYFLGYRKLQNDITVAGDQLRKTQEELKHARELNAGIEALRSDAQEMCHLVEVFEKRLPEEREIPELLGRFERLGGEIGLRVQLSSLPTRTSGNMEIIPYKAVAFGQFHQIATFINMLDVMNDTVGDRPGHRRRRRASQATFVRSTPR